MSELQAPLISSFLPSSIVIALALIFLVMLAVMKRPSPPREASGAIALTIATIILLSGVWSMWLSPTLDTRRYYEIFVRSLMVEPLGSVTQTFEAKIGQEIEVNIDFMGPVGVVTIPGSIPERQVFPTFSGKIFDPRGRLIWTQTNITKVFFAPLTRVTESGTFKAEVNNPQKETVSLTMRVQDRTKITIRPLEPLGQWLTLISIRSSHWE